MRQTTRILHVESILDQFVKNKIEIQKNKYL